MARVASRRSRLIVSVTDERGRAVRAAGGLGRWIARLAPARARGTLSVALVSDAVMQRLNRRYHDVDRPTDVLSFPSERKTPGEFHRGEAQRNSPGVFQGLGDMAIALGVARRQAREQGHSLQTELRVLALHGLLHLLGYDHEVDQGQMKRAEDRLRRRAGLPVGLTGRPSRSTRNR